MPIRSLYRATTSLASADAKLTFRLSLASRKPAVGPKPKKAEESRGKPREAEESREVHPETSREAERKGALFLHSDLADREEADEVRTARGKKKRRKKKISGSP